MSIQMSVRQGPATLLSVCENEGKVHLLVAEGESVPGETLQIGNTNSRYRFPMDIREFMNRWSKGGPSHHCAIGVGHVASKIEKLAALMKIPAEPYSTLYTNILRELVFSYLPNKYSE